MSSGKGRLLVSTASLLIPVVGLYNTVTLGDPLHLVCSVVAAVLYTYLRDLPRLLTGFSWCLLETGVSPYSTVAAVLVSFLTPLTHGVVGREPLDELLSLRLTTVVLAFTPLYLLKPLALIPATSYVASILALTSASYLRLSKSRVSLGRTAYSAYLGDYVDVPLGIEVNGSVSYGVLVNETPVLKGFLSGSRGLTVRLLPRTAGVHTYTLKVVLSDLRHFSRITHGPYVIKVRAIPKSTTIVRSVRELLIRYVGFVRTPTIYAGRLEAVKGLRPSREGGVGGEVSSGTTGTGAPSVSEGVSGSVAGEGSLGGGEGAGVEVASQYGEVVRYRFRWVVPARILEFITRQATGTAAGDYAGVREYCPGDHPKSIHWKKSLSVGELVVKIFAGEGEGGGGRSSLVIADWDASNPLELDNLIQATYSALLTGGPVKMLYLRLPNGKIYLVKGDLIDVLSALDFVMSSEDVEARFNYEGWIKEGLQNIVEELKGSVEPLKSLDLYYRTLAKSVADELERQGLPKGSSFFVIHPRAYALKYTYLAQTLRTRGHVTTYIAKALQPGEVAERLRELISSSNPYK